MTTQATTVLCGLENGLSAELGGVLRTLGQKVHILPFLSPRRCLSAVARFGADLIFCPCRVRSLRAMLRQKPDLPIVVVSRLPETTEWLDAIEAGACDYCAPPFEPRQVQWILDSVFKHRPAPLVPRAATSQSEGAE